MVVLIVLSRAVWASRVAAGVEWSEVRKVSGPVGAGVLMSFLSRQGLSWQRWVGGCMAPAMGNMPWVSRVVRVHLIDKLFSLFHSLALSLSQPTLSSREALVGENLSLPHFFPCCCFNVISCHTCGGLEGIIGASEPLNQT